MVGALIVLLGLYSFYRLFWFLRPEGSFQTMTVTMTVNMSVIMTVLMAMIMTVTMIMIITKTMKKLNKTFAMSFILTIKLHAFLRLWDVWANTLNFDGVCSSIFI